MSNEVYTTCALYLLSGDAMRWLSLLGHDIMKYVFLVWVLGSFEPLAPEPQVAHELAKGAKDKSQTQGDEEYGEREN